MVTPEQPFVFFPEGLDVRWRSFAVLAEQVEGGRRALGELSPPPGAVVAYRWRAGPDAVAADLAIRVGGWTALPLGGKERPGREGTPAAAALLLLPGESGGAEIAGPAARARLPEAGSELRRCGDSVEFPAPADLSGGAAVKDGGSEWRTLEPVVVASGADRLGRRIEHALGAQGGRAVVVAALHPAVPEARFLLEWVIASQAALYPEEESGLLGGVAGWVRPSVLAGDAAGLTAAAVEIRRRGGAWKRAVWWRRAWRRLRRRAPSEGGAPEKERPPGRLRVAVLLESGGAGGRLDPDALALFAHHGVRVIRARERDRWGET